MLPGAMLTRKETLFAVIFIFIAALFIFRPRDRDGDKPPASLGGMEVYAKAFMQDGLKAPFDCSVFLRAVGGSAGATSEVGLGTTPDNFRPFIWGLPREITDEVVELGKFREGESIPLAIKSNFSGDHYAFMGGQDRESITAFTDKDGSLEEHGKQLIEPVGERFLMHLDDAASFSFDDNDQDLLVEIWFEWWEKS